MRFSNVRVHREGDQIQLRFDLIYFNEEYEWSRRDRTIQEALLDEFKYPDRNTVREELNHQALGETRFSAEYSNTKVTVPCISSSYRLPTDPVLALDFLAAYKNHVRERNFHQVSAHNFSIHSYLVDAAEPNSYPSKNLPGTLEQYISTGMTGTGWGDTARVLPEVDDDLASAILKKLVEKIIAVAATMPNYKATFDALSKISQGQAKDSSVSLKDCLDISRRYSFLCDIPHPDSRLSDSSPAAAIERYVREVGKKLTAENRMQELNHFMDNFQLNLKVRLFAPCIGKTAEDGGKYNWTYTEWALLKDAQFNLRPDGKLGIVLANNAGYQEHYAQGRRLFANMEKEMRFLGSVIGLEYDDATDFHKELVFTSACSQRLLASGMHLSPERLKQLLQPQYKGTLFNSEPSAPAPVTAAAEEKKSFQY